MSFISDLLIEISSFRIRVGNKLNALGNRIGNLTALTTSNKTDLVGAINEVNGKVKSSVWEYGINVSIANRQALRYPDNTLFTSATDDGLYEINLATTGTSTLNGSKYILRNQSGSWSIRVIRESGSSSNHPQLEIDANGIPVVYTSHPATYSVMVSVRKYLAGTSGVVNDITFLGLDYQSIIGAPTVPTSADYITTNTNQTGLTGNKTTSGVWTFGEVRKAGQNDTQMLLAGGGHRSVIDFALAESLDNYLPLAGGTMNNNVVINWLSNGRLTIAGVNRLVMNLTNTFLSATTGGTVYFRPNGHGSVLGQVTIDSSGQINTANHGNSRQWNHEVWGLGTNAVLNSVNWDLITETAFYYNNGTATIGTPIAAGSLSMWHINQSTSSATQLCIRTGSNQMWFRRKTGNIWQPWVEVYHTGNFNPAQYVLQSSLNTQLNNYATKAGTQTFTGQNTFTQAIYTPAATLNGHAVNLGQLNSILSNYTTNENVAYYNDGDNVNSNVSWGTNVVGGARNQIQGGRNIVKGEDINIFGSRNVSSGINNQINGFANVANGAFNTINGAYSSINGSQSNVIGNYLFARDKQTVLGMYNKVYDVGQDEGLRFAFGTGINDLDKYNAVEIYDDHRTEFHGKAQYNEETRDPEWFTEDYTHVDTYQVGYDHLTHRANSSTPCEHNIFEVAVRNNHSGSHERFVRVNKFELAFDIHGIVKGNLVENTIDRTKVHTKGTLQFSDAVRTELLAKADIAKNPYLVVEYIFDKEEIYVKYVGAFYLKAIKSQNDRIVYIIGSFISKRGASGQPGTTYFEFNQQII